MTNAARAVRLGTLAFLIAAPGSVASGQMGSMSGGGRSLGGYGGATISSYYAGRGSSYVPYAGGSASYAPSVSPPRVSPPVSRQPQGTAIGGAAAPGMDRGGGMAASRSPRRPLPMAGGMGMGGSLGSPMTSMGSASRGTPGPGLGWPFRMPPALPGPASMGAGMR